MTKFYNAHIVPPRGGWVYPIGGAEFTAYTEGDIIQALIRWQQNNGKYVSDAAAAEEIWAYYCAREPVRCGMTVPAPGSAPDPSGLVPADKTPEVQGPPIWLFLNTLAAQWNPALHAYFLATVDAILVIIECPDCREEWRRLVSIYPPAGLTTRFDVCRWVNKLHNAVNAKRGKMNFPYAKMVTEFGAPPS